MPESRPEAEPRFFTQPKRPGTAAWLRRNKERLVRASPWPEAAVLFASAFLICLGETTRISEIHADTIWQLLRVRDCLEGSGCHVSLASPSSIGIRHGAVYLHFLVALHWLGGDYASAAVLFAFVSAAGLVLFYLLSLRIAGRLPAMIGVFYYALQVSGQHSTLWNATLTPAFAVLCLCLLFCATKTRRPLHLLLLAIMISVALQVHLAFGILLLPLGLTAFLQPRPHRFHALAVAGALVAGSVLLISPGMLDTDLDPLSRPWLLVAAPFAFAGIVGLFLFIAKRIDPFVATLILSYLPFGTLLLVVAPAETRYLHVLLPGVVLTAIMAVSALFELIRPPEALAFLRRAGPALGLGLLVALLVHSIDVHRQDWEPKYCQESLIGYQTPTMDEAAALAELLRIEGWSYGDAFRGLRGGASQWLFLNGLAYYLEDDSVEATESGDSEYVSVHRVPADVPRQQAEGWTYLEVSPRFTTALRRYRPWLRSEVFDACLTGEGGECALTKSRLDPGRPFLYEFRANPFLPSMPEVSGERSTLLLRLPVRIPPGEDERIVVVPTVAGFLGCRGRIEDVEGIRIDERLPSTLITLRAAEAAQEGFVLFSWTFGAEDCPFKIYRRLPPPILELSSLAELDFLSKIPGELQIEAGGGAADDGPRFLLADIGPPWEALDASERPPHHSDPTVPLYRVLLIVLALVVLLGVSTRTCLLHISATKRVGEGRQKNPGRGGAGDGSSPRPGDDQGPAARDPDDGGRP